MTATNHVMTGALIAVAVQRPLLAIPLAFLSHFILDVIPHFGYGDMPSHERDAQKHFLIIQVADAYTALGLFLLMPLLLSNYQSPIVTAICMLAAQAPDALWVFEYAHAQRRGHYKERNWFKRFHKAIQWCERQWGAYVESVYFAGISSLIWLLAK